MTLIARFESKYIGEPNSGCWLWIASLDGGGYGKILVDGRRKSAHITSYNLFVGTVPYGLELDHKCRTRCCVNPNHLEPVTPRENTRRSSAPAASKARAAKITHCPAGHEYTVQNTYLEHGKNGYTMRHCRACDREKQRARRAMLKKAA